MKYILGIDVGTSNVKAVIFDEDGNESVVSSRESKTVSNGGNQVEQNMEELWEKVKSCVKEVMDSPSAPKDAIIGIGVTGQGEGCWLIDKEGKPVQNAILWCDGRAVKEVKKITQEIPEIGMLYHTTTGTPPLLGNQMMLLKWMKNNHPDILDKADKLFFCKDWIRYKLTGKIGAEITDSLTSLLDVKTGLIAKELMREMGIGEYENYLPKPVRSDEVVGAVLDEFADYVGLSRGTPVIAGAIDTAATAVGLGVIHEKDVCVILGTTCASEIVMKKEDCNFGMPNSRYEKHPLEDLYVELQPTLNGTPNIDWMLEHIAKTKDFQEIDGIVENTPVGCGGVVYHPYISVAGERAPFYHPYARASFFGISQVTTREHLIRAVYEGISLSIRDCLGNVDKSGTIYLAGGGAKSPVWAQMIADVMGMKVLIPAGKELGAKGVALMAGVSQGLYSDYEEAVKKACKVQRIYEPNLTNTKKYDLLYELYKKVRLHNQEIWDYRHQMNKKIQAIQKEEK